MMSCVFSIIRQKGLWCDFAGNSQGLPNWAAIHVHHYNRLFSGKLPSMVVVVAGWQDEPVQCMVH